MIVALFGPSRASGLRSKFRGTVVCFLRPRSSGPRRACVAGAQPGPTGPVPPAESSLTPAPPPRFDSRAGREPRGADARLARDASGGRREGRRGQGSLPFGAWPGASLRRPPETPARPPAEDHDRSGPTRAGPDAPTSRPPAAAPARPAVVDDLAPRSQRR